MSKKHFIALADKIREANRNTPDTFTRAAIVQLAVFCGHQNPQFNQQRWMDYIDGRCVQNGGAVKAA